MCRAQPIHPQRGRELGPLGGLPAAGSLGTSPHHESVFLLQLSCCEGAVAKWQIYETVNENTVKKKSLTDRLRSSFINFVISSRAFSGSINPSEGCPLLTQYRASRWARNLPRVRSHPLAFGSTFLRAPRSGLYRRVSFAGGSVHSGLDEDAAGTGKGTSGAVALYKIV